MSALYLDHNAGAPIRPQVAAAMAEVLAEGGNPSSVHAWGRRARARVEAARHQVAQAVEADAKGVIFTSGGTEANALALKGCGRSNILVSAIEHASVLNAGVPVTVIPVLPSGVVDVAALERMLAQTADAVVSVMAANNETGIVQPIAQVVRLAHAHGALVHCDAAQAVGRMPVSVAESGVDFLTLSAHKLGGPAGVGALVLRNGDFVMSPQMPGGGQEGRRRGGTENVAGIVGMGVAIAQAVDELDRMDRIQVLRDRVEAQILARVPGAAVIGQDMTRLPNTLCLALAGLETRTQVMALDLDGIMIGAGAACSSGKLEDSAVLKAMGLEGALSRAAIRLSWGWNSTPAEGERFLEAWTKLVQRKGLPILAAADAA